MSPLRRLQALEQQRRQLFERLENIDPDLLNRCPAEGRWSMIQVACHLVGAEKLTLSYIQRKVDPEGLPDVTVSGWLRLVTLAIALRSPFASRHRVEAATSPSARIRPKRAVAGTRCARGGGSSSSASLRS